jgi:hypothetical protein
MPHIYLKREDLNHTGAHKINNALGQAMLCKRMGKERIIAETGAGQHGVATVSSSIPQPNPAQVDGSADGDSYPAVVVIVLQLQFTAADSSHLQVKLHSAQRPMHHAAPSPAYGLCSFAGFQPPPCWLVEVEKHLQRSLTGCQSVFIAALRRPLCVRGWA